MTKILDLKGRTAVFIDAANIELSAKDLKFRIDYQKLKEFLERQGEIIYLGFYTVRFETKSHDNFLTVLKKLGYKLVTKPIKIIKKGKMNQGHIRKTNFDVEIVVEAMKRVNQYKSLVLFFDIDFEYLLKELKKQGKEVFVVSLKYHIAKELKKAD